ncbi:histidine ammonia-lyase [Myxococcus stipitatus DSM 14675]|uniref:Histidine ammonia-lyase n=1 Tax=Myxococcus stipitatus (strain DSM 14675 / JCM 12634 / Mx s8) TaxID=1278073 RepID=L7UIN5_MYXSD|nr:aromatic amino acid ammonia-lyase [Myxococcus stipitatus]AGC46324.1 histidine ammonia-lyase [Myxococcus stipitatus DSM 14675]
MPTYQQIRQVILGPRLGLTHFMAVARAGARVDFSEDYRRRVERSRALIDKALREGRVIYGVTTGVGSLSTRAIDPEEMAQLQRNIVLSHAVSVGSPFSPEEARGTMLMVLQNLGQGFSGVRLEVLESLRGMLNRNLIPWMPREGSVGYLAPEAHLALVVMGEGRAYWEGTLLPGRVALERAGLSPLTFLAKEGLALLNGTSAVTALGAVALHDLLQAAKSADIIGAISLEALRGLTRALDERVMKVRPHPEQAATAANVRAMLQDSEVLACSEGSRLQDALSLRCIPQLHGAAKKMLNDARETLEIELNSCCDNPIVWDEAGDADVISAGNCDSSYVGLAMDGAAIAATMLAKMSERRNSRFLDENVSGHPAYLVKTAGLDSGLMIPQYTQVGLLGDMRILSTPSSIDSVPTCALQEDYVAMGYNASKKALTVAGHLEYVLAIELLSGYQAQQFLDPALSRGVGTRQVLKELARVIPVMSQDMLLHPHMEWLRDWIHSGRLVDLVEEVVGELHER